MGHVCTIKPKQGLAEVGLTSQRDMQELFIILDQLLTLFSMDGIPSKCLQSIDHGTTIRRAFQQPTTTLISTGKKSSMAHIKMAPCEYPTKPISTTHIELPLVSRQQSLFAGKIL
jgi:hypothetical protein